MQPTTTDVISITLAYLNCIGTSTNKGIADSKNHDEKNKSLQWQVWEDPQLPPQHHQNSYHINKHNIRATDHTSETGSKQLIRATTAQF